MEDYRQVLVVSSLQECSYLENQLALLLINNSSDENIVEDVRPSLVMENGRPVSPIAQKNNEFSLLQYEDSYMSSFNNSDEILNESKLLKTSWQPNNGNNVRGCKLGIQVENCSLSSIQQENMQIHYRREKINENQMISA